MEKFRTFYTDNGERLFGYLLRKSGNASLAADLAQEAFTRYLESYRHRDLNLALLFTIGRNLFYDHVRKQGHEVEWADVPDGRAEDQEHAYIVREESALMLAALQQLDEEDRDILALVVSSGLTYSAIAGIRGCSESNIKVRVHRARQKLRQLIPEESP